MRKKENYNLNSNSKHLKLGESFKAFLSIFGETENEPDELENYIYSNNREISSIARELLNNTKKIEQNDLEDEIVKKKTRGRPAKSTTIKVIPVVETKKENIISINTNQNELDR